MTIFNYLKLANFCHYFLCIITFIVLLVICYIFYIKDAIEESQLQAKTLTKRSMTLKFEPPAIIICPKPAFKPSISRLFNLSSPVRSIFLGDPWDKFKNITDVQELHEEFSDANDLTFLFPNGYVSFTYWKFFVISAHNTKIQIVYTARMIDRPRCISYEELFLETENDSLTFHFYWEYFF